ncbi:MAG: hypothetical protein ACI9R3_006222 [Verrucomicrobiales bacterium]|jgi:hypothetical protein
MKILGIIPICLCTLIIAVSAKAQESDLRRFDTPYVTIEWQFGLAGKIFGSDRYDLMQDFTNPVSFLITNHRNSLLEGELVVGLHLRPKLVVALPLRPGMVQRTEKQIQLSKATIAVGPGSTKRISLPTSDQTQRHRNSPSFITGEAEASFTESASGRLLWRRSKAYVVDEMARGKLRCLIIGDPTRIPTFNASPFQGNWGSQSLPSPRERQVDYLRIDPWQAPDSFPNLAAINAVVLSPELNANALTLAQHRALAEYVANSGIVVLPVESADGWREKIFTESKRLPFSLAETENDNLFLYGNGKVLALEMPVTNGLGPSEEGQQMYDLMDLHPEPPLAIKLKEQYWTGDLGPNAAKSAMMVAGIFGIYTIVSLCCLYLFRRMRRAALIRALIVMIALFSTGAVGTGVYVGAIPGDVEWISLTEVCQGGGAIQHGRFHFNSAGSRNQEFAVEPAETLLQQNSHAIERHNYYDDSEILERGTFVRLELCGEARAFREI